MFTLGLTEAWVDKRDDAVFPIAPGVAGGETALETVEFKSFDETEIYKDLSGVMTLVYSRRPNIKTVLTVSPVPLSATCAARHVLVSTVWSKSIL